MIETTYFGWAQPTHAQGCTDPNDSGWNVTERYDTGAHPPTHSTTATHACTLGPEHCSHNGEFPRLTLRLVCRAGCGAAHIFTGQYPTHEPTATGALGYGQPPRQVAGLYLWPGAIPLYNEPTATDPQPTTYLVTRDLVPQLTPAACIGRIGRYFDSVGTYWWRADVGQVPLPGRLTAAEVGHSLSFARRETDLPSVEAAAAWIATAIDPAQQRPVVVTV